MHYVKGVVEYEAYYKTRYYKWGLLCGARI